MAGVADCEPTGLPAGRGRGDNPSVRIIAGSAGRMRIKVPSEVTRPTTDFVRQALFSMLGEQVADARVLDLFAGSGALGLEALSRGARSCRFVDQGSRPARVIEENLARTGLAGGSVIKADVFSFLSRERGTYDLVLADPPYVRTRLDRDFAAELLGNDDVVRVVSDDGWLVVEVAAEASTPESGNWELLSRRSYGGSAILLYARRGGA